MFEKFIAMFRGKSTPSLPTSRVSSLPARDAKSIWRTGNSSPEKEPVPSETTNTINPFQSSLNKEEVAQQADSIMQRTSFMHESENKELKTITLFVSRPDAEATLTGYNIYDEVVFNTSAYCNPSQKFANHYGNPECNPLYRFGRTPAGKYVFDCVLPPNPDPNSPFAGFPVLRFLPISGECARAEANGRNALMIIGSPGNPDTCPMLDTDGSIRVSGNDIVQLVEVLKDASSGAINLVVSYASKKQQSMSSTQEKRPILIARPSSTAYSRPSVQAQRTESYGNDDDLFMSYLFWSQIYNSYVPPYSDEPNYQWPAPDADQNGSRFEDAYPQDNTDQDTDQSSNDQSSGRYDDQAANQTDDTDYGSQTVVPDSVQSDNNDDGSFNDSDPFAGSGTQADTSFSADTSTSWATDTTY